MSRRFVLLDWSLVDLSGHAYEYDGNVLDAFDKAGWETEIYVHRDCSVRAVAGCAVRPRFSHTPTDRITRWRVLRPVAKLLVHWWRSGGEARTAVAETDGEETLFFVQHAEAYHLPALIRAFRGARGRLMLMLRATSLAGAGAKQKKTFRTLLYRLFLPRLAAALGARLILVTDSSRLTAEYAPLAKAPVRTLPIPNPERTPPAARPRTPPLRVLMAGRMSFEKGIQYLPGIVALARARGLPVGFTIHVYHHPSEAGVYDALRARLEALEGGDVTLVREPLSTDAYWEQTSAADVSLLLYDVGRYRNQTSNLVLDAMACGTFPLVSEGTWLSDVVTAAGFGAAVPMADEAAVAAAAVEILSRTIPGEIPPSVGRLMSYHRARSFRREVERLLEAEII
jgi:glycosyltransferase involved in cell wall biosynthesis